MKKLFQIFLIAVLCILPHVVHAEEIKTFQDTITIHPDGTFTVHDVIVYDFGDEKKHGIFYAIPVTKTNDQQDVYRLGISNVEVNNATGVAYPFTQTSDGSVFTLKVGDPQTFVSGQQTYIVRYDVSGGLTYFSDHDELYWRITGNEGTVPIQKATSTVSLPFSDDDALLPAVCFIDVNTEDNPDCVTSRQGATVSATVLRPLSAGEKFTIVVGFPKGIVAPLEPQKVIPWTATAGGIALLILITIGLIFWYLALPIWIVIHWFRTGRDPTPPMGETSAWFDVPKTSSLRPLTPGETGALVDESVDMRDITATIVDLARRGYLKIIETKKNDFTVEKQKTPQKDAGLEDFETILYKGIFHDGGRMRVKDIDLSDTFGETKNALYDALVKEKFFDKNPNTTRTIYTVLGFFGLFTLNFPLVLAAFIFGRAMPKKTLGGAQTAAVGRSLKNFIISQDRQFAYQAKKQLLFEKFLPYAIAFGVEKIWAERFKDIKLTKPDWYDGYGTHAFTSVYFVNSLTSSMHSVVSAATPTRSSSGFSSGFSGGGSAGGGASVGSW